MFGNMASTKVKRIAADHSRQISCLAVLTTLLCDIRLAYHLLLVVIHKLDNICRGYIVDCLFDHKGL